MEKKHNKSFLVEVAGKSEAPKEPSSLCSIASLVNKQHLVRIEMKARVVSHRRERRKNIFPTNTVRTHNSSINIYSLVFFAKIEREDPRPRPLDFLCSSLVRAQRIFHNKTSFRLLFELTAAVFQTSELVS